MQIDEKQRMAEEAKRIKENDAALAILAGMRAQALEALAATDATDAEAIREQQSMVRVVDRFFSALDVFINEGKPKSKPGIV